mmetsp:Transcript_24508/g.53049  ORF Transcript_24508/g.53049 Transcript_24508/m.53049 type:complete len:309 (-) Transcript_24508:109-1035(-)
MYLNTRSPKYPRTRLLSYLSTYLYPTLILHIRRPQHAPASACALSSALARKKLPLGTPNLNIPQYTPAYQAPAPHAPPYTHTHSAHAARSPISPHRFVLYDPQLCETCETSVSSITDYMGSADSDYTGTLSAVSVSAVAAISVSAVPVSAGKVPTPGEGGVRTGMGAVYTGMGSSADYIASDYDVTGRMGGMGVSRSKLVEPTITRTSSTSSSSDNLEGLHSVRGPPPESTGTRAGTDSGADTDDRGEGAGRGRGRGGADTGIYGLADICVGKRLGAGVGGASESCGGARGVPPSPHMPLLAITKYAL